MDLQKFSGTLRARVSDDGVLWLTKVNADMGYGISMKMLEALENFFTGLQSDESIRAVVIDAEDEAMQGGAIMVSEIKPSLKELTREDFAQIVQRGQKLGRLISSAPVPVISIAKGGIFGGGLELMMRSDFAFCTDNAKFSLPEVTVGFIAAWGGAQWGGRFMPFRKAQEMLLTGLPIDGKQAEDYGLVTRSFSDGKALDNHVTELLEHLRSCSPTSLKWTKQCLASLWEGHISDGEKVDVKAQVETMDGDDFLKAVGPYSKGHYYDFVDGSSDKKRK